MQDRWGRNPRDRIRVGSNDRFDPKVWLRRREIEKVKKREGNKG